MKPVVVKPPGFLQRVSNLHRAAEQPPTQERGLRRRRVTDAEVIQHSRTRRASGS